MPLISSESSHKMKVASMPTSKGSRAWLLRQSLFYLFYYHAWGCPCGWLSRVGQFWFGCWGIWPIESKWNCFQSSIYYEWLLGSQSQITLDNTHNQNIVRDLRVTDYPKFNESITASLEEQGTWSDIIRPSPIWGWVFSTKMMLALINWPWQISQQMSQYATSFCRAELKSWSCFT